MGTRLELQQILENILGSRNVYYQPPETIKLKYPAIIYSRNNIENIFADNNVYIQTNKYQIIVIDMNPDSDIVKRISKLPMCKFNRHYTFNNLNHDVFTITY